MKWAYDLCGAEPIIKDELVYDAATIAYGELLMLGTAAFSAGTNAGIAFVTAVPSTAGAGQAADAIGISLETKTTASVPSVATAANTTVSTHACYVKTIINPFAVYRAAYTTADAVAVAASASTNEIQITGVGAHTFNGSWVWFSASAGPNYGQLRMCVTSGTAATIDLDAVSTNTITTADTVMFIDQKNTYSSILSADALSISQSTVGPHTATNLRVVETYIEKNEGVEILKYNTHKGIDVGSNAAKLTKFYNDVMMKDHIFGVQE